MSINIDLGAWNSIFAVPSKVVDEGLKFSDGVKLKVLLFVLRNAGRSVDDTEISKATGVNVTDIPEALDYWVSMGVFNRIENTFTPVKNNEEFVSAPQTCVQTEQTPQPVQTVLQPQQTVPQPVQAVQEPVKQETEQSPKENAEEPQKHFTATRPQKPDFVFTAQRLAVDEELKISCTWNQEKKLQIKMEELRVADAITEIFTLFKRCNKYIDETMPWALAKKKIKKTALQKYSTIW